MAEHFTIFVDGSSKGNPGQSGVAFVVFDDDKNIVCTASKDVGKMTNNQAEYLAVEAALDWCLEFDRPHVTIKSDSELIVKQLNGVYQLKNPRLLDRYAAVKGTVVLLDGDIGVTFEHIPREDNHIADKLAKAASDGKCQGLVWE